MDDYAAFLASKAPRAQATGIEPRAMPAHMWDFQQDATAFLLRQGCGGLFFDTGLGKTTCELEFLRQAAEASNGHALLLTPLAVAQQIEQEARRWGYDARVIEGKDSPEPGISICNYDQLSNLATDRFGAVALDESSILKSFTGATTRALIEAFRTHRFKLCATATPAPNDHMELGQHAEFLGIMPSNEMLARWFTSDQTQMGAYRLKKHGETAFWDWMATWSRCAETPTDLGYDGSAFVLPELKVFRHRIAGEIKSAPGELFSCDVSATNMFLVKRQTAESRASTLSQIVMAEPDEPWIIWVDTDFEADAVSEALPGVMEVRGSQSRAQKEAGLMGFRNGSVRWLMTKSSIAGMGLNYQHCARMAYVGRSFSYESNYQSVRRCWRFGQKRDVHVHLLVAEGEAQIGRVIDRKATDHHKMKRAMAEAMKRSRVAGSSLKVAYNPQFNAKVPSWIRSVA